MKTLNLDSNFKPQQGQEISFQQFLFPGGEPHIRITSDLAAGSSVTLTHRINSFNDLGLLCLAADALNRMQVKIEKLIIPYFPAARQDRVMVTGEPLSVKVYAEIINQINAQCVVVLDAHSEVTPAVLNNCISIPNHAFIKQVMSQINEELILISPDGGALKKIYKVSHYLGGIPVVECSKRRDVKTGKISGFQVYTDNLQDKACLIVDDICDGGSTFIGLTEEFKKKNAGKLYLAVSHGIFSKGFDELSTCFTKIFTTNSVKELSHPCLTQILINDQILS
ncbi:MAG: ribose-phosphate pyrophosphokinase [Crocinitomicaceae bacterium]|nr:ribose-phosphate pyrophosphokinase [Crocinitomicaceae bacterium]MBK8926262.1 ribose-phosphate pyrophosphokinase [Crocinitomicaceae bacterium]